MPSNSSSSRSPSGPSARTHAATLPRTVAVGVPSRSRSAISTPPLLIVTQVAALGRARPRRRRPARRRPRGRRGGSSRPGARRKIAPTLTSSPGARRGPRPVVAPLRERAEHRHQVARALGQLVVDARRHLAVALTREQAVGDHPVQARAQLLRGDAGQHALQLDEAPRAGGEVADDQQRPLVADKIERACIGGPLVIRVTLGGRRCRDGRSSGFRR